MDFFDDEGVGMVRSMKNLDSSCSYGGKHPEWQREAYALLDK